MSDIALDIEDLNQQILCNMIDLESVGHTENKLSVSNDVLAILESASTEELTRIYQCGVPLVYINSEVLTTLFKFSRGQAVINEKKTRKKIFSSPSDSVSSINLSTLILAFVLAKQGQNALACLWFNLSSDAIEVLKKSTLSEIYRYAESTELLVEIRNPNVPVFWQRIIMPNMIMEGWSASVGMATALKSLGKVSNG